MHGGGSNSYTRNQNLIEQYLASKGFVVMAINYRGGSGFGREFQDLAVNDWLNGQAKDPGAAADLLRTLPYVTGKVGIYGGSYGGMQSMAAITRTPDKFDAAVPMRGIFSQTMTFDHMDRLGKDLLEDLARRTAEGVTADLFEGEHDRALLRDSHAAPHHARRD